MSKTEEKKIYTAAVTSEVPASSIEDEAVAEDFISSLVRGSLAGLSVISTDSRDDSDELETEEAAEIEEVA